MANERRLIDANALPVVTLTDGGYWTKDVVYKLDVDAAPTVDAVEVVRCKDCKYQENCIRRVEFMGRNPVMEQNTYEYHPLDFCSYGERRCE